MNRGALFRSTQQELAYRSSVCPGEGQAQEQYYFGEISPKKKFISTIKDR